MEDFWRIVAGWSPLGQGIFFFFAIAFAFAALRAVLFYTVTLFRGWPPPELLNKDEDDLEIDHVDGDDEVIVTR